MQQDPRKFFKMKGLLVHLDVMVISWLKAIIKLQQTVYLTLMYLIIGKYLINKKQRKKICNKANISILCPSHGLSSLQGMSFVRNKNAFNHSILPENSSSLAFLDLTHLHHFSKDYHVTPWYQSILNSQIHSSKDYCHSSPITPKI